MDILKYKEYEGTAELDMARGVCRGKILFITDVVTYEAATPAELQKEFEAAVDDYLETCVSLNRDPQKPLKGQFNVRVPVALHKAATLRAYQDKASLNDVVVQALDAFMNVRTDSNPVEIKSIFDEVTGLKKILALASGQEQLVVELKDFAERPESTRLKPPVRQPRKRMRNIEQTGGKHAVTRH